MNEGGGELRAAASVKLPAPPARGSADLREACRSGFTFLSTPKRCGDFFLKHSLP